ncbi:MAG: hypothetical protein J0L84_14260, partial [Verrucomicrobia bacterium]|nr:hypothetical protein [Verrucomicrobiota bacterium]
MFPTPRSRPRLSCGLFLALVVALIGEVVASGVMDPAASPGAPQRLVVGGPLLESGLVSLSWLPVEGAVSYEILRGTDPAEAAAVVIATNVTASPFVDLSPPHAVDLYYRVRAVAGDSVGPWAGPLVTRQDVLLWTRSTAGRFTMPVVFTNGTVVVGVNRRSVLTPPPDLGVVYAIAPQGELVWQRQTGGTGVSHPVITPDERVMLAAGHNWESVLWSATASGDDLKEVPGVLTTPFLSVAADGTIFLAGQPPGMTIQVRSLDSKGTLQWSDGIGMGSTPIRFSVHPDGLLAVGNMGLTVFTPDGHRHWVAGGLNQSWGEPAWAGTDRLMAVNSRQELIAFRADGTPLWTNRIVNALSPIPGPA